jgi:hypothetical protein
MRRILCDVCATEIGGGDDLFVVAHWGVLVRPYCAKCYAKKEKSYWHHSRTGSIPLNSRRMSWGLLTSLGAWLIVVLVIQGGGERWPLGVLAGGVLWIGILRAYSYFRYERVFRERLTPG